MLQQQEKFIASPYTQLYELIVPKDNLLRKIKEIVDFEFVRTELIDKYCPDNSKRLKRWCL